MSRSFMPSASLKSRLWPRDDEASSCDGQTVRTCASDLEHLHDFVAQVVDHLYRDAVVLGFGEGAGGVAV